VNKDLHKISKSFCKLINFIEKIRPGFLIAVGEGYSAEEIYSKFSGRNLSDGLVAIYLNVGRNSQDREGIGASELIPGYDIIPLFEIKSQIDIYAKIHEDLLLDEEEDEWETDMIPFLENGCGCHYCVRTLEEDQSVYYIDKVEERSYICHDSSAFFDMIYEMYQEGAYYINEDEDNKLDCKWDLAAKIEDKYSCQTS
jgi:hypothetical protein